MALTATVIWAFMLLLPRVDEGRGVGVGCRRRELGALALGDDRDDVVGVGVGAGLGHLRGDADGGVLGGREVDREPFSGEDLGGALAHVGALDHGPDRLQLGGTPVHVAGA